MGQTNNHKSNFHFLILGCKYFAVNYSLKSGTHRHHQMLGFIPLMSRCVFGFGFSLVCYVYSCELVCFEPHYLLVVCTRDPLLGQCVYVLF